MTSASPFTAHNGFSLPPIGLGTYKMNGAAGASDVAAAINAGYRLLDSAFNYENEGAVGAGMRASGIPREELIVTTKIPGRHHITEKAVTSIEESRFRLGVESTDLHLIHWPNPARDEYVQAWAALVDAQARGVVKQIGVSNFLPEHLERIEAETGVRPVVNQIEVHPYFPQEDALAYHREKGIITEAWSPIGRGQQLLQETVITDIAQARGMTPAQVVLAWHMGRGAVAIPKASSLTHQQANLAATALALETAELAAISALGRADGRLFDADPATHEEM